MRVILCDVYMRMELRNICMRNWSLYNFVTKHERMTHTRAHKKNLQDRNWIYTYTFLFPFFLVSTYFLGFGYWHVFVLLTWALGFSSLLPLSSLGFFFFWGVGGGWGRVIQRESGVFYNKMCSADLWSWPAFVLRQDGVNMCSGRGQSASPW